MVLGGVLTPWLKKGFISVSKCVTSHRYYKPSPLICQILNSLDLESKSLHPIHHKVCLKTLVQILSLAKEIILKGLSQP